MKIYELEKVTWDLTLIEVAVGLTATPGQSGEPGDNQQYELKQSWNSCTKLMIVKGIWPRLYSHLSTLKETVSRVLY